jgi:hypothetical protein
LVPKLVAGDQGFGDTTVAAMIAKDEGRREFVQLFAGRLVPTIELRKFTALREHALVLKCPACRLRSRMLSIELLKRTQQRLKFFLAHVLPLPAPASTTLRRQRLQIAM